LPRLWIKCQRSAHAYNHNRPHQAIDMAVPASLFRPNQPLRRSEPTPVDLDDQSPTPAQPSSQPQPSKPAQPVMTTLAYPSAPAVEFDTVILASGVLNVIASVQRIKMGIARAGQSAHVWVDEFSVHISIDGQLVKTAASNLNADDLTVLRLRGARLAGPAPQAAAPSMAKPGRLGTVAAGAILEVDRRVGFDGGLKIS
jgi:hypothetical protein